MKCGSQMIKKQTKHTHGSYVETCIPRSTESHNPHKSLALILNTRCEGSLRVSPPRSHTSSAQYSVLTSHPHWRTRDGQNCDSTVNLPSKLWSMSHAAICSEVLKIAKVFIKIETENSWVSPYGESWHSRQFFLPTPHNSSHAMLRPGGTPYFVLSNQKTAHPKALSKGPHRHLALGLISGSPARQGACGLGDFISSPGAPTTTQTLESGSPSTQLCPHQMPVLRLGSPWT